MNKYENKNKDENKNTNTNENDNMDNNNSNNGRNNGRNNGSNNECINYKTKKHDTTQDGGWLRVLRIGKDKCSRLIRKAQDTMNKIKKIEENGDDDDNEDDDADCDDSHTHEYYLSGKPRTREQILNDKYNLKQQMERQVSMLAHVCDWSICEKDNGDSNDDGYNNNTQEAEADVDDAVAYEDEDEKEREKREQERKYRVRKMFWRVRDDDDPFWDDDDDIGDEFFN